MDIKCEAHIYQVLTDECQDGKLDSNYVQFTTVDIHGCLYLSLGLKKIRPLAFIKNVLSASIAIIRKVMTYK